jgi:hypothetical protein
MGEGAYETLPAGEMRAKYGLTSENHLLIILDPERVPPKLRSLIPLAERFGIADHLIREDVISRTAANELVASHSAEHGVK